MGHFDIIDDITHIKVIAISHRIRILPTLQKRYGQGRWRKLKGQTTVQLPNGDIRRAEIHWFEAQGIGKKQLKIKRFLD